MSDTKSVGAAFIITVTEKKCRSSQSSIPVLLYSVNANDLNALRLVKSLTVQFAVYVI